MQKQVTKRTPPEAPSEIQCVINNILGLGGGKEDLHKMLDDFYLAYLADCTNYNLERIEVVEHFYLFSNLQKMIRVAKDSDHLKSVQP